MTETEIFLAYNELAYSVTFEDTLAAGSDKNKKLNKFWNR